MTQHRLPGVTITWAQNPLQTTVSLDEIGRLLLWHRLKIEDYEERITSAYFDIDPEHIKRFSKETTPEKSIADALRALDVPYVLGDEKRGDKTLDEHVDERCGWYVEALAEEHYGDCTCTACSCTKCHAEGLLGIETIAGLGNHAASKIAAAFKPAGTTIDEAVERLRDYRPVYTFNERWPEEEWSKNVPRWIEEGKRAYEWLDAYRRAHFATRGQSTGEKP